MLKRLKLIGYFCSASALFWALELSNSDNFIVARDYVTPQKSLTDNTNQARQLLTKGIELYQQESYVSARDAWLKSSLLYEKQNDILGTALALNNLALAYQQLGEWQQSETTVVKSLNLLQSQDDIDKQPGYWEILGKNYNTWGNWQWQTGEIEKALDTWGKAAQYYTRADYSLGVVKAQINQAKALQNLGFTVRAVNLLTKLNFNLQQESNSEVQATGLRYLGTGYRNLGRLTESVEVLKQSVEVATTSGGAALAWLELGNTYRQQGDRFLLTGKQMKAREYFSLAMQAYQQGQTSDSLLLRSQLNQLSLLMEGGEYSQAKAQVSQISLPEDMEANRSNIYLLLNYARSLTCLRSSIADVPLCNYQTSEAVSDLDLSDSNESIQLVNRAIAFARSIQDTIAEAQALYQLAQIYELNGDLNTAKELNQQGLMLLEGKSAPDIAYLLQWQRGRILKQQQEYTSATIVYSQAIASVEEVRENILAIDPIVQFSFRDRIEPVYRQYVDLLLSDNSPSQENLRQAIKTVDALQLAELENFLGCQISPLIRLDETTIDAKAAQIYPIVLSDRLVVIIEIPGKPLVYQQTPIPSSQVIQTADALQNNLSQPGKTPEVLQQAQQLYQWLIEPHQSLLESNPQIETLVFVPDSLLRNIPLGILYDGEQYLIEKDYALVVTPQLELFAPGASVRPLRVLTGGVEISQTIEGIEFPAIAQVQQELNQISTEITTNDPLINEAFTQSNIREQLEKSDFSAIHWKTHGIFSSDPRETFIVAYQDSIKANELQSLVQTASQDGQKPLELLVLSACETAKGDNRAILGLAGLTVKTGARTALSTFWRADDRATTLLMTEFYQQLDKPGITKAEALKQAQLSLLKQEGYVAPYYWGTYVLIGNWL